MTSLTKQACEPLGVKPRDAERSKNFFALGLISWMYTRPEQATIDWINEKFGSKPAVRDANLAAFRAGHAFGETAELFDHPYTVQPYEKPAGVYTTISGNTAIAWGLVAASQLAKLPLFLGSYPITPASDILHELSKHKNFGVRTMQAEDEIAGIGAALGAAYGGHLAVTTTSGPGRGAQVRDHRPGHQPRAAAAHHRRAARRALHRPAHQDRAGRPAAGHVRPPRRVAAADRVGVHPVGVLLRRHRGRPHRPQVPHAGLPAHRRLPGQRRRAVADPRRVDAARHLGVVHHRDRTTSTTTAPPSLWPYLRDPETLARPWVLPGTPGLEHRIGGIEKEDGRGNISYVPENHERMVHLRAAKIAGIANDIPAAEVVGDVDDAEILIVGWGSTWGAINGAMERVQADGRKVAHVHLTHLNPFPANLGEVLHRYPKVVVPEMNIGQLSRLLRAEYLVDAKSVSKVKGLPFTAGELEAAILGVLDD